MTIGLCAANCFGRADSARCHLHHATARYRSRCFNGADSTCCHHACLPPLIQTLQWLDYARSLFQRSGQRLSPCMSAAIQACNSRIMRGHCLSGADNARCHHKQQATAGSMRLFQRSGQRTYRPICLPPLIQALQWLDYARSLFQRSGQRLSPSKQQAAARSMRLFQRSGQRPLPSCMSAAFNSGFAIARLCAVTVSEERAAPVIMMPVCRHPSLQ